MLNTTEPRVTPEDEAITPAAPVASTRSDLPAGIVPVAPVPGVAEGEQVVASGQFLIDSEASLSGLQARPVSQ